MAVTASVSRAPAAVELWGGVECTVNRVGDTWHDQLSRSGHDRRIEDLDTFHALGLRTLRYPFLWERLAPRGPASADWTWSDERLNRLRDLRMEPIAGLVHHGSGPPHTSLLDESFATGLAAFAGAFAARYPWVRAYTPVNEPNTTARFSALYGHWYPHQRDAALFCRALVVQCRATVLAMAAIRRVNPAAQLVQTDDAGRIFSAPALAYQADFENARRWLTWDLLSGFVDVRHPLWAWLRRHGISATDLEWFQRHRCPPDVIGLNYYVTSDRYLDDRCEHYPSHLCGGNARHRYADIEAVRAGNGAIVGHEGVLRAAWERYRTPVALTEVHLGCSREDQLRWLDAAWTGARAAAASGVDVKAICAWALLGSFDWASLVTRRDGEYEPGPLDVRSTPPRVTALGAAVRELASGGAMTHPVAAGPGWWMRQGRPHQPPRMAPRGPARENPLRPLLVAGGGEIAATVLRRCAARGLSAASVGNDRRPAAFAGEIQAAIQRLQPWAVVYAPECPDIDPVSDGRDALAHDVSTAVETMAAASGRAALPLVFFSSHLVFDGRLDRPCVESDPPAPRCPYGAAIARAERAALESGRGALVLRTGTLFTPDGAAAGFTPAGSSSYLPEVVDVMLDLLIDGEAGIWHLVNGEAHSRNQECGTGSEPAIDREVSAQAFDGRSAHPRGRACLLGTVRGTLMSPLDHALARCVNEGRGGAESPSPELVASA